VAVSRPEKFCWYDAQTGKLARELPLPEDSRNARLSSDGKRLIVLDRADGAGLFISLLKATDGKRLARHASVDGDRLLSVSDDGRRALWKRVDESSGVSRPQPLVLQVQETDGEKMIWERDVPDFAFRARFVSGRFMVICTDEGAQTWDVERDRLCGPAAARGAGWISPTAISPDGRMLLLGLDDEIKLEIPGRGEVSDFPSRPAALVEIATGQVRARLPVGVDRAHFTSDGRHLVTAVDDGTVLVWAVDEIAARSLTGREWADLAGDARAGFVAVSSLVVHPAEAIDLFADKLPLRIDAKRVRRWLGELADDSFDVRQAAEKELAALGDHVEEDLRREMARDPAPEARTRLAKLLEKIDDRSPDGLRRSRAVEVLERVGSDEAAAVLKRLAAGHAGARQTRESADALARLKERGR
jgi:hypothetical protein